MRTLIVPVNDLAEGEALARKAVDACRREPASVLVLNVQRPLPMHIAQFFSRDELAQVHRDEGGKVLASAERVLREARVPFESHVLVGKPAETIVQFAEDHPGAEILMDPQRAGLLARLGVGSIASQVQHLLTAHAAQAPATQIQTR
jgi:nucleotide-binding universal stress UspA family protein